MITEHKQPSFASRMSDSLGHFKITALRIVVLIGLVGIWQAAHAWNWVPKTILPAPAATIHAFIRLHESGELWFNFVSTISATLIALLIGGGSGIIIGLLLALLPTTEKVLTPFIDALNSAPRIALAPIFIVIFGIGQSSKIAMSCTLVLFILILSARSGVHSADEDNRKLLTVMGASKTQIFFKLLLPVSIPSIASGLRLGLIWSLLGVVTMELIASRAGLGQLIAQYSAIFSMAEVYAVILLLIVVASLLNSITRYSEERLLAWRPPTLH